MFLPCARERAPAEGQGTDRAPKDFDGSGLAWIDPSKRLKGAPTSRDTCPGALVKAIIRGVSCRAVTGRDSVACWQARSAGSPMLTVRHSNMSAGRQWKVSISSIVWPSDSTCFLASGFEAGAAAGAATLGLGAGAAGLTVGASTAA